MRYVLLRKKTFVPVIFKRGDKKAYENENKRIVSNKVIMEHAFVGKGNAWSHCRAFREVEGEGRSW